MILGNGLYYNFEREQEIMVPFSYSMNSRFLSHHTSHFEDNSKVDYSRHSLVTFDVVSDADLTILTIPIFTITTIIKRRLFQF